MNKHNDNIPYAEPVEVTSVLSSDPLSTKNVNTNYSYTVTTQSQDNKKRTEPMTEPDATSKLPKTSLRTKALNALNGKISEKSRTGNTDTPTAIRTNANMAQNTTNKLMQIRAAEQTQQTQAHNPYTYSSKPDNNTGTTGNVRTNGASPVNSRFIINMGGNGFGGPSASQITVELNHNAANDAYLRSHSNEQITQDWLFTGRLLKVKGLDNNVLMKEVKCRRDYMNSGDVFILDTALNLYVWNGEHSNDSERAKAKAFAESVIAARGGNAKLVILNEGVNDNCQPFWDKIQTKETLLGFNLRTLKIKSVSAGGDDLRVNAFRKKLYRLTDRNTNNPDQLKFKLCATASFINGNHISASKLDSGDVFILDDGFKIWVWVGKHTSEAEKRECVKYAVKYVKQYKRPTSLPIEKIEEGHEPIEFRNHFGHYKDSKCTVS